MKLQLKRRFFGETYTIGTLFIDGVRFCDTLEDANLDKNHNGQFYNGETKVLHYLELLRDIVGFDNVANAVKKPLEGKKIGAYYGCLLLRPGKVMGMDDPENPHIIEDLIRALGGEPVVYARRNECCGGYVSVESPATAQRNSLNIVDNAVAAGAEMLVTACPLCKYNLEKHSNRLPVVYLTELLAEALGIKED